MVRAVTGEAPRYFCVIPAWGGGGTRAREWPPGQPQRRSAPPRAPPKAVGAETPSRWGSSRTSRLTRGGTPPGPEPPPLSLEAGENSATEDTYIETSHDARNSLPTTTKISGRDKQTDWSVCPAHARRAPFVSSLPSLAPG